MNCSRKLLMLFSQIIMSKRSSGTLNPGSNSKKLKLSAPGSLDHMTLPAELVDKVDFTPTYKTADDRPWNAKVNVMTNNTRLESYSFIINGLIILNSFIIAFLSVFAEFNTHGQYPWSQKVDIFLV